MELRNAIKALLGHPLLIRLAGRIVTPRVAILCYHDLREEGDFTSWMRVSVAGFREQLRFFRSLGRFIHPDDLLKPEKLTRGRLHFLLTFDDGYANNHRLALPLLEEHRAPALFFVSTRHVRKQAGFWIDRIVTPVQVLQLAALDLRPFGLKHYRFRPADGPGRWDDVQRVLLDIKSLGNASHPAVSEIMAHLDATYAQVLSKHLPRLRPLTAAEIVAMAKSSYCRFGSHGHAHDILTLLDDESLRDSLTVSRGLLEDWTARPITHLAYPNGDFDARVLAAAAKAGYARGYRTGGGLMKPDCPPLELPRLLVGGYDSLPVLRFKLSRLLWNGLWG